MQVEKQQLELDMEQLTGSKLGKEYVKAVYCYPAYLTTMQSTLCKMPGWSHHFMTNRRGKSGSGDRFSFLCFHNHCGM